MKRVVSTLLVAFFSSLFSLSWGQDFRRYDPTNVRITGGTITGTTITATTGFVGGTGAFVGTGVADETAAVIAKASGTSAAYLLRNSVNVVVGRLGFGDNLGAPFNSNHTVFRSDSGAQRLSLLSVGTFSLYMTAPGTLKFEQTITDGAGPTITAGTTADNTNRALSISQTWTDGTTGNIGIVGNFDMGATGTATGKLLSLQAGAAGTTEVMHVTHQGIVGITGVAIASLPTAGTAGRIAVINDQTAACPAKGVAPTAGGALVCVVFDTGAAWAGI